MAGFPAPGTVPSTRLAPSSVSLVTYEDAHKQVWDAAPPSPGSPPMGELLLSCGSSSVRRGRIGYHPLLRGRTISGQPARRTGLAAGAEWEVGGDPTANLSQLVWASWPVGGQSQVWPGLPEWAQSPCSSRAPSCLDVGWEHPGQEGGLFSSASAPSTTPTKPGAPLVSLPHSSPLNTVHPSFQGFHRWP